MKKYLRLRSATKLALFSAALIIVTMLVLYALLILSFEAGLRGTLAGEASQADITKIVSSLYNVQLLLGMFIFVAVLAYVVSSLIIDRALNPVRVMIEKVKSVGRRDFNSRIFIESSEDELTEYAVAFNQMSFKINEYIESQKRFISDASHELVTPIAVIVGHADMLIRWGKDDPDTLTNSLTVIKSEALAMNELVENLLFFARSDNNRMVYDKKNIDLASIITDCVSEQRRLHPEFNIIYNECGPLYVYADQEALKRVMRILFANSVKYSPDIKQITVSVKCENTNIRICVSDCGIGIAPDYLSKIFSRFYRVDDSRTKDTGGTGLGLAIAKEILDAHGCKIEAQSTAGNGTDMIINISSSNLHNSTMTSS